MLKKRWHSWSSVEKLVAVMLPVGVLLSGIVWFTLHMAPPSKHLPGVAARTVTPQQKNVAAILPVGMPRACADALRPAAVKAEVKGTANITKDDAQDDVRLLAARRLAIPVAGAQKRELYDSFTDGRGARKHEAIDIHAPRGTPVIAAGDGCVVKMFRSIPGGITLYQFDPEGNFAYYYAHLDGYAEALKEGTLLQRGDVLGYVGTTGNASANAPHLHFAIFRLGPDKKWWKGTAVNPYSVLTYP